MPVSKTILVVVFAVFLLIVIFLFIFWFSRTGFPLLDIFIQKFMDSVGSLLK